MYQVNSLIQNAILFHKLIYIRLPRQFLPDCHHRRRLRSILGKLFLSELAKTLIWPMLLHPSTVLRRMSLLPRTMIRPLI